MALEPEASVSLGRGRKDRGLELTWSSPTGTAIRGGSVGPPLRGCLGGSSGHWAGEVAPSRGTGLLTHMLPCSPAELCHAQTSRGLHEDL